MPSQHTIGFPNAPPNGGKTPIAATPITAMISLAPNFNQEAQQSSLEISSPIRLNHNNPQTQLDLDAGPPHSIKVVRINVSELFKCIALVDLTQTAPTGSTNNTAVTFFPRTIKHAHALNFFSILNNSSNTVFNNKNKSLLWVISTMIFPNHPSLPSFNPWTCITASTLFIQTIFHFYPILIFEANSPLTVYSLQKVSLPPVAAISQHIILKRTIRQFG